MYDRSTNSHFKWTKKWGADQPALFTATRPLDRVLLIPFVGKWIAPAFVPSCAIVAGPANVIAFNDHSGFCVLQSRVHESWARFLSSSLEDRQRYTPSDCFETFPFPNQFQTNQALDSAGKAYYDFRAALMVRNNEGLTKTYNRFHDPDERSPDILKLRELHAAMDRAVLDAYGWTDLKPTCEFLLDYEEDEEDDGSGSSRRRKKPWRYRWPDDFRDEVLAKLLELNRQRAEEERLSGAAAEGKTKKKATRSKKADAEKRDGQPGLPGF